VSAMQDFFDIEVSGLLMSLVK